MRLLLVTTILSALLTNASAVEARMDGPVLAGGFGMGGADYYGDVHSRMPFSAEAPPRPVGMVDITRARAASRRPAAALRRAKPGRRPQRG
jgi:hypothetical protein